MAVRIRKAEPPFYEISDIDGHGIGNSVDTLSKARMIAKSKVKKGEPLFISKVIRVIDIV